MGVKELWKVLRPAVETESLTQLAMRGFDANTGGYRGYRVGIDLSIWLGHTKSLRGKPNYGKHADIRMLFFRLANLLAIPILPVFVFDGILRPHYKRGKPRKYSHDHIAGLYKLIEAFGFECHYAPGEAEAELAYLNRIGVIDAIWTDDSDVFLFGAVTVMRNQSSTLSSNRVNPVVNSEGKQDNNHVHIYRAVDLMEDELIQLDRDGLILLALLRGGDYHDGVKDVGIQIAHGLARCGFGQSLATAVRSLEGTALKSALAQWRSDIVQELYTNSRGQLGTRHPKLGATFPQDFPNLDVYRAYANPIITDPDEEIKINWYRPLDLSALAALCEYYFDWAGRGELLERFRSKIWPGAICRALRHRVLEVDGIGALVRPNEAGLENLVVQLHASRAHASTDKLRELRLEINPSQLADIVRRGTSGLRIPSPKTTQASAATAHLRPAPTSPLRLWIPAALLEAALPELVHEFEAVEGHKKRQKRTVSARHGASDGTTSDSDARPSKTARNRTQTSPGGRQLRQQGYAPKQSMAAQSSASASTGREDSVIVLSSSDDDVELVSAKRTLADDVIVISSSDDD